MGGKYIFWILGGAACVDRLGKVLIETRFFDSSIVGWRYFAMERHHNFGVAFNTPIPLWVVAPLTIAVLTGFVLWMRRQPPTDRAARYGVLALLLGATSNLFDRLWFGYTIDYLRILNGIINVADMLVIVGIVMLLRQRQKNAHT